MFKEFTFASSGTRTINVSDIKSVEPRVGVPEDTTMTFQNGTTAVIHSDYDTVKAALL